MAPVKEENQPAAKEEEELGDAQLLCEEDLPDKVRSPEEYYEVVYRAKRTDREWLCQLKEILTHKSANHVGDVASFTILTRASRIHQGISACRVRRGSLMAKPKAPDGSCKKSKAKKNKRRM